MWSKLLISTYRPFRIELRFPFWFLPSYSSIELVSFLCLTTCGFPNTLLLRSPGPYADTLIFVCSPLLFYISQPYSKVTSSLKLSLTSSLPQINFLYLLMVWLYIIAHIPLIIVTGFFVSSFRLWAFWDPLLYFAKSKALNFSTWYTVGT